MSKSFFFYGYIGGEEDKEEVWKVLHDHFEKLAGEDDARQKESVCTERKAVKKRHSFGVNDG